MYVYLREGLHGEGEISQEVIEEQFAVVLSRDYAGLLGTYVVYIHVHAYCCGLYAYT